MKTQINFFIGCVALTIQVVSIAILAILAFTTLVAAVVLIFATLVVGVLFFLFCATIIALVDSSTVTTLERKIKF